MGSQSLLMVKVESEQETQDRHLGSCMIAYRSSKHSSTGYTPYTLMFGRGVRLPVDVMMGDPGTATDNYGDYVSRLRNQLFGAFRHVLEQLKKTEVYKAADMNPAT